MRMRGTWYIVPTPFDAEGELDLASLRRLVEATIALGRRRPDRDGGDGRARRADRGRARGGAPDASSRRAPGGCRSPSVAPTAALCDRARADRPGPRHGRGAAMVAAPPAPAQRRPAAGLFPPGRDRRPAPGHPGRAAATGVLIPVSTLLAAAEASGSRTMKIEDPPTPAKIGRVLAAEPELDVFGGLGGVSALGELRRGACGTMTGFAYPEILRASSRAHRGRPSQGGGPALRPLPAADPVRGAAGRRPGHPQGGPPPAGGDRDPSDPRPRRRPSTRSRSKSSTTCSTDWRSCPARAGSYRPERPMVVQGRATGGLVSGPQWRGLRQPSRLR